MKKMIFLVHNRFIFDFTVIIYLVYKIKNNLPFSKIINIQVWFSTLYHLFSSKSAGYSNIHKKTNSSFLFKISF